MNKLDFFRQYRPYLEKNAWYESPVVLNHLIMIFDNALRKTTKQDIDLFERDASEWAICGALMQHLKSEIWGTPFKHYKIDVEYNRNFNNPKAVFINQEEVSIICDLIIHSRGKCLAQDNLLAVEMKKGYRTKEDKRRDKDRLIAMTLPTFDDIWVFDGTELPQFVCRYIVGVYCEFHQHRISLEYYHHGRLINTREVYLH